MNWFSRYINATSEDGLGFRRDFAGFEINIENSAGTERYGVDKDGKEWRIKMKYDYGFLPSAKGADGEGLDIYLGPDEDVKDVYVVHQNDPKTGKYDEDKVMCGFGSAVEAKKAYLKQYDSPDFFGSMTTISVKEFRDIVNSNDKSKITFKKKRK